MAVAVSKKSKAGMFSGLIGLLSIAVSSLTGERGLIFLFAHTAVCLAGIVWKPKIILFSF